MKLELTERELRYLNHVVNMRLDELMERCARIRRIHIRVDIETSERLSISEAEITVLKSVHDKVADSLADIQLLQ
ncbi:MAG: hypothetical protein E7244_15305 [Enterocloster citroniae]|nr:hypothetical protein [Enterocloster citroniae]